MQDNQKLEKFFTNHNARPIKRFPYREFEVYICEGGPYFDKNTEYPFGWYESAYALGMNDKVLFYQPLEFDYLHDIKEQSEAARKEGRINAAIKAAKNHIDHYHEAKRLH